MKFLQIKHEGHYCLAQEYDDENEDGEPMKQIETIARFSSEICFEYIEEIINRLNATEPDNDH